MEWARHGENVANLTETFSHRAFDGELTDRGQRQAHKLGQQLSRRRHGRPVVVVCSPLRRARQTAQVVGEYLHLPIAAELDGLRELDVGSLDGRNDAQAWATYRHTLSAWRAGDYTVRFPDGEDCHELCERLRRALTTVAELGQEGPAMVVAHGANLRAVLPRLTGVADPGYDLNPAGMARLDVTLPEPVTVNLLSWGEPAFNA